MTDRKANVTYFVRRLIQFRAGVMPIYLACYQNTYSSSCQRDNALSMEYQLPGMIDHMTIYLPYQMFLGGIITESVGTQPSTTVSKYICLHIEMAFHI